MEKTQGGKDTVQDKRRRMIRVRMKTMGNDGMEWKGRDGCQTTSTKDLKNLGFSRKGLSKRGSLREAPSEG
jgi:hypothetical protein